MKTVGVKFKENGMTYYFSSEIDLEKGEKVIVETERGDQLGIVSNANIEDKNSRKLKQVKRKASDEDYDTYLKNLNSSNKALKDIREEIKKEKLNMNVIDASYSLDKKVLLFNFISDERVDFRELLKVLAGKYHARIELHQVGARDKAKEISGLGPCGRPLCCASNITNISSVNINMVKNQNIALNPTKINGLCGRLLCCFNYENEVYEEKRAKLPKIGEKVKYKGKNCEVVSLNILEEKYKIQTGEDTFEEVSINDKM